MPTWQGYLKYGFSDIRDVLERASARSTAATVGCGAIAKIFLRELRISVTSVVISIGGEVSHEAKMRRIQEAMDKKDTVGGVFEIRAFGVPVGLGSYVQPDRRLDSRLSASADVHPRRQRCRDRPGLRLCPAARIGSPRSDLL